jgi:hypothetical protein
VAIRVQSNFASGSMAPYTFDPAFTTTNPVVVTNTNVHGVTDSWLKSTVTGGGSGSVRSEVFAGSAYYFQRYETIVLYKKFMFETGFNFNPSGFQLIHQWKGVGGQSANTSPPVAMHVEANSLQLINQNITQGNKWTKSFFSGLQTGVLYEVAVEAYLDGPAGSTNTRSAGWMRVLMKVNGAWVEMLPRTNLPNGTFYPTDQGSCRVQTGLYRSASISGTSTVWCSYVAAATSLADFGITVGGSTGSPPAAPTNLSAVAKASDGTVAVNWTNSSTATTYGVYRRVNGTSTWSLLATPTTGPYTDRPGVGTFDYTVDARNASGASAQVTPAATATMTDPPPPVSGGDVLDPNVLADLYLGVESQLGRTLGTAPFNVPSPTAFPHYTVGTSGTWNTVGVQFWTAGMLAELCWKTYDRTGVTSWRDAAVKFTSAVNADKTWDTHDVGSVFRAYMQGYEIMGTPSYLADTYTAADTLSARYNSTVGAIQSLNVTAYGFNTIIDSAMSTQLMFWAARNGASDASTLYTRALAHMNKLRTNHVRGTGGSWQVVTWNTGTGAVVDKPVRQGYSTSSTWARGQAWGIYGFTLAAIETASANPTDSANFRATAAQMAGYFVDNLPADGVVRWDFDAPSNDLQKDTSAQAIAAAGMFRLAAIDTTRDWRTVAGKLLTALNSPTYQASSAESYAILKHGVSDKPGNVGVDVGLVYADTFWLEALDLAASGTGPVLDPDVDTVDLDGTTLDDVDVDSYTGGVSVSAGKVVRSCVGTLNDARLTTRPVTVANRAVAVTGTTFAGVASGQTAEITDSLSVVVDATTRAEVRRHKTIAAGTGTTSAFGTDFTSLSVGATPPTSIFPDLFIDATGSSATSTVADLSTLSITPRVSGKNKALRIVMPASNGTDASRFQYAKFYQSRIDVSAGAEFWVSFTEMMTGWDTSAGQTAGNGNTFSTNGFGLRNVTTTANGPYMIVAGTTATVSPSQLMTSVNLVGDPAHNGDGGAQRGLLGLITQNAWIDWVVHYRLSHGSDGLAEFWRNGVKVHTITGQNLQSGMNDIELRYGFYQGPQINHQRVLILDQIHVGPTLDSVDVYGTVTAQTPGTSTDKIEARLVTNGADASQVSVDPPSGINGMALSLNTDGKTVDYLYTTNAGSSWARLTAARAFPTPVFLTDPVTVQRSLTRVSGTGTITDGSDDRIQGLAYITPAGTPPTPVTLADPTGLNIVSITVDAGNPLLMQVGLAWDPLLTAEASAGATWQVQRFNASTGQWNFVAATAGGTSAVPVVITGMPQGTTVTFAVVKVLGTSVSGRSNTVDAFLSGSGTGALDGIKNGTGVHPVPDQLVWSWDYEPAKQIGSYKLWMAPASTAIVPSSRVPDWQGLGTVADGRVSTPAFSGVTDTVTYHAIVREVPA